MNELELYVDSLDPSLSNEEKVRLVQEWKKANRWKEQEVEVSEQVELEEVDLGTVKKKDGVPGAVAPSMGPQEAPELVTEFGLEDTFSVSPEPEITYDIDGKNVSKEEFDIYTEKQKNKKPKGQSEISSWESIKNSFINTGNQIKGVLDFWGLNNIPGTPISEQEDTNSALDIATNAVYSFIFGQENVDKYVNWVGEDSWLAEGLGSKATAEDIEKLKEEKKETLPTKGIIESYKKGDVGGVIAGSINAVSNMVGSIAYNTGTGGTGFFMDYTADNYINYNEQKAKNLGVSLDELILSGEAETAVPIGIAVVQQGLEVFALGKIVGKAKKGLKGETPSSGALGKLNKYLSDKLIYSKTGRTTVGALSSAKTEFSTEVLQYGAEEVNKEFGRVAGTEEIAKAGKAFIDAITSEEGLEQGVQGAFGGSSVVAGSYSIGAMKSARQVGSTINIDQSIDNLTSLRNKQREVDDKTVKQGIQIQIDNLESQISDAVVKGNKIYENLNDQDISTLETTTDLKDVAAFKITDLNKKLRGGKISQDAYDLSITGFKEEYKQAEQKINKIVSEAELKDKTEKLDIGAKKIAEEIGTGFESFDTQEDVDSAIATLQEEGGKIDTKSSDNYATFVVLPNDRRIVILNKETATEDKVFTGSVHDTGHAVLYETVKNKPEAAIALGESLLNELQTNENITIKPEFKARLDQYIQDADISQADTMEEVLTLTSEGLTDGTIEINETIGVKLGNFIRRALSAMGMKVKFKNGKDVLNFIKDYNRSVHRQKGLSRGLKKTAIEGAEVAITPEVDIETEIKESVAKESKRVEDSQEVQRLYDEQGVSAAMEIIEKFKPITSKIVESRSQAPNFDRQLLTDEIETGKRGILDLVMEYKPESGVPLAAYINKFLPARAIEASQRVLGEEFTTDVTEAKGVVAEEVTEVVEEKPTKLTKPSSLLPAEAVAEITEQVKEKIKGIDPKSMTFKKLGDLAPEVIAREIGIPVKKLTDPRANLSKGDATAIQQFVNKNADKLLRILPEGSVTEAATDDILGTSTGVPTGFIKSFLY
jgi:hypothetical protein